MLCLHPRPLLRLGPSACPSPNHHRQSWLCLQAIVGTVPKSPGLPRGVELIHLFQSGGGWYSACYTYACQKFARTHPGNTAKRITIPWGEMVRFTYKSAEGNVVTSYVQSQKLAFFIVASLNPSGPVPPELPGNLFELVYLAIEGVYERCIWVSRERPGMNCGHHHWWNRSLKIPAKTFRMWTVEQCNRLTVLVERYRTHSSNRLECNGCNQCSPK